MRMAPTRHPLTMIPVIRGITATSCCSAPYSMAMLQPWPEGVAGFRSAMPGFSDFRLIFAP